jgi:signal transduction histidine kinase
MRRRWQRRSDWLSPFARDVAAAVVVAVLGMIELWATTIMRPHAAAATPFYLIMASGVALRRRSPLVAVVVTGVAGDLALATGVPINNIFIQVLAFLIVTYSVAAHCEPGRAVIGLAVMVLLVWTGIFFANPTHGPGDYFQSGLELGAPWVAGRAVWYRFTQAMSAERRAVMAENEASRVAQQSILVERERIARELHDIVSHGLSLMIIQAGAAERVLDTSRPKVAKALQDIQNVGREALLEMQRLLAVLRLDDPDDGLSPQPSLNQLDQLITSVRSAGLPLELRIDGEVRKLPPGLDLCLYRLIQEALTNALKHAGHSPTRVNLHYGADQVDLEVIDIGSFKTTPAAMGGHGLIGMRERVAAYGGRLDTGVLPDGGFAVRASLPVAAAI